MAHELPDALSALEPVDGSVFHYTSSDGLLGLLNGQSFWASEAASLNDIGEIRQGWDFVRDWLASNPGNLSDQLLAMTENLPRSLREAYVLSASVAGDDANQWRLYGGQVRGYAVEIDTKAPLGVVLEGDRPADSKAKSIQFGQAFKYSVEVTPWLKCLYEDSEKSRAVEQLITAAEASLVEINLPGRDPDLVFEERDILRDDLVGQLYTIASLMKSDGFIGEREARVVATPIFRETFERFRSSEVGVVSYVELGTAKSDGWRDRRIYRGSGEVSPLPIRSVTAGPLLRAETLPTLRSLLDQRGHGEVEVRSSGVPLR